MPTTIVKEPTSGLPRRRRIYLCLLVAVIGITGCSDLTTVLRDELALESEVLDRIAFVVDEASAAQYNKTFQIMVTDKKDVIDKKKTEIIDGVGGLAKVPKLIWKRYELMISDLLKKPVDDDMLQLLKDLGKSGAADKCMEDLKELLNSEKKFAEQPGAWEKALPALPPPKVMHHYMREKLALRIAKHRETLRLKTLIDQKKITF